MPFVKFGGLKFLDAAHIKDALALLRFAENPRDRVAGFRVAQLLPGIGPANAEKIVAAAALDDGFETLKTFVAPAKAREAFAEFVAAARRASRAGAPWPADLGEVVAWRRAHLEDATTMSPRARPISTRWSASRRPILRASGSSAN